MTIKLLTIAALAAVTLAGCDNGDHTIVAGEHAKSKLPKVAPIDPASLPPAIVASKAYRCKDNALVYIDWLADGSARIKMSQTDVGTQVKPGEEGAPLTGSATDASVTYNGKSCKA